MYVLLTIWGIEKASFEPKIELEPNNFDYRRINERKFVYSVLPWHFVTKWIEFYQRDFFFEYIQSFARVRMCQLLRLSPISHDNELNVGPQ